MGAHLHRYVLKILFLVAHTLRLPSQGKAEPLPHPTGVTSIMDPPTLGLWHSLQSISGYSLLCPPFALSDEWPHRVITVQLEPRADPKELLWIGKGPLFYEHRCSCTRHRAYCTTGWYWPTLHRVPRQRGGGETHLDLVLGAASSIIWSSQKEPQTDIVRTHFATPSVYRNV